MYDLMVECLNPCFSGTYSRRAPYQHSQTPSKSLNPCFSGTYSRSDVCVDDSWMNLCLNPCFSGTYSRRWARGT